MFIMKKFKIKFDDVRFSYCYKITLGSGIRQRKKKRDRAERWFRWIIIDIWQEWLPIRE
jgi:hypothetical protein